MNLEISYPSVIIYTDSKASANIIKQETSTNPILLDIANAINKLLKQLETRGSIVQIIKIPAHELSDSFEAKGNHKADILAGIGCTGYAFAPSFKITLPRIETENPPQLCDACKHSWNRSTPERRENLRRNFQNQE